MIRLNNQKFRFIFILNSLQIRRSCNSIVQPPRFVSQQHEGINFLPSVLALPSCSREYPPCVTAFRRSCTLRAPTFVFAVDCGFGKPKWCRSHATGHQRDLGGSMDELFTRLCRRVTVCRSVRLQGQACIINAHEAKAPVPYDKSLLRTCKRLLTNPLWRITTRRDGPKADNCSSVHFTMSFYLLYRY